MKKYNVQPRLYDGGKRFTVDRYTLVYRVPKPYQTDGCIMLILGCSPSIDGGFIRCCWDCVEKGQTLYGHFRLGKKVKLESMPKGFIKAVNAMSKVYNQALNENTKDAWNKWERY